tara:strand:- start:727 stop:978 length:252 start_codon:yes stop_codon:yes gene_type:complete
VLLARRVAWLCAIPKIKGRQHVVPQTDVDANKINFIDPSKLRRTWVAGEKNGNFFSPKTMLHRTAEKFSSAARLGVANIRQAA